MGEDQGEQAGEATAEQAGEQQPERPEVRHAEEVVNRMGQRVDKWTAVICHRLRQSVARAREAGEDIVAEAQAISQRQEQK